MQTSLRKLRLLFVLHLQLLLLLLLLLLFLLLPLLLHWRRRPGWLFAGAAGCACCDPAICISHRWVSRGAHRCWCKQVTDGSSCRHFSVTLVHTKLASNIAICAITCSGELVGGLRRSAQPSHHDTLVTCKAEPCRGVRQQDAAGSERRTHL